jgi:hypothetical protein
MNTTDSTLRLLQDWGPILAGLSAMVVFLWSVVQFFLVRRRDAENRDFEVYHRLVKELVQPDSGAAAPYMDRQAAVVFELRHFPKYFQISLRTLHHLREAWKKPDGSRTRILDEIDLTIQFLQSQSGSVA